MNPEHWKRIENVRSYLSEKREIGIEGFKQFLTGTQTAPLDLVVVTFTYEHLEIAEKVGDNFKLNNALAGTINRYEIEDLYEIDYDENDVFDDFLYVQISTLVSELIKYWVADCFHQAQTELKTAVQVYYKEQHDQMEIFDLSTFQTIYEQSEFETFVRNNQSNLMQLLP